ncbi:PilZ domain-containing protein [Thiocystis violacea]|uniref:PilZ domain-containing protein n=1 Tax=Thiocystis violacea TaxID=13725 RepID=UPI0019057833|nr:PilZ domain-containing protein [Thiocystis violacea]
MSQSQLDAIAQERRTQARIRVRIPARLSAPGWDEPLSVRCQDLSWGGLLLDTAQCLPGDLERLRIELDWMRDDPVRAEVRILRTRPLLDGHYLSGMRFVSLSNGSQARLERWLTALRASARPGDCAGPDTLVRELEIMANDQDELRQMLEQVAKGRLTLTVFDAYAVGQSISCVVTGTEYSADIRLRARVLEAKSVVIPGVDWTQLCEVTLGFEHPLESVRRLAGQLPGRTGQETPQIQPQVLPRRTRGSAPTPTTSGPEGRSRRSPSRRSALEAAFPEVLNYLAPGWGDAQTFETLFRDLVLGDRFQLGGWPDEVWQELTLLQDVHDLAYGVSPLRTTVLKGGRPG